MINLFKTEAYTALHIFILYIAYICEYIKGKETNALVCIVTLLPKVPLES